MLTTQGKGGDTLLLYLFCFRLIRIIKMIAQCNEQHFVTNTHESNLWGSIQPKELDRRSMGQSWIKDRCTTMCLKVGVYFTYADQFAGLEVMLIILGLPPVKSAPLGPVSDHQVFFCSAFPRLFWFPPSSTWYMIICSLHEGNHVDKRDTIASWCVHRMACNLLYCEYETETQDSKYYT